MWGTVLAVVGVALQIVAWRVVARRADRVIRDMTRGMSAAWRAAFDRLTSGIVERSGQTIELESHDTIHGHSSVTLPVATVQAKANVGAPALTDSERITALQKQVHELGAELRQARLQLTETVAVQRSELLAAVEAAGESAEVTMEAKLAEAIKPEPHERWAVPAFGLGLACLLVAPLLA